MGTGITIILKDSVNDSEHKLDGFLYDREKNTLECKRTNNYEDLKNSIKGAECYTFFNYHDDLQNEDDVLKCMICILFLEVKKELDAKKYLLRNFDKIAGTSYGEAKDEYLEKAKEMIKGRLILRMEDSRSVSGWAASQDLLLGKIRTIDEVISIIDSITTDDLNRVANDLFTSKKLNLAVVGPNLNEDRLRNLLNI